VPQARTLLAEAEGAAEGAGAGAAPVLARVAAAESELARRARARAGEDALLDAARLLADGQLGDARTRVAEGRAALEAAGAASAGGAGEPPPPHPVLIGHAVSFTPY